jgi:hypothetical protein
MTVERDDPTAAGTDSPTAPIFILTGARSGSTLLRYILDAHPDLGCPPETGIPQICAQLTMVWSAIYDTARPSAENRISASAIPDEVIAEVRSTVDAMIERSLAGRGKPRFCDKSMGAAKFADLLVRLYPEVRFVCLVRHPMDFIMSAIQATPWGPVGYGFDEYVVSGSGNMVRTLARYWIDHTAAITSVASLHPGRSCMMRYEDLVDAPELIAGKVFEFLGVSPQPGITQRCLQVKREQGQGDHKIWWTSEISSDSIGRGETVPQYLLTAPVRDQINRLLDQLGYVRVDENWGAPVGPVDPRLPGTGPPIERRASAEAASRAADGAPLSLEERLRAGLAKIDDSFRQRWSACSDDTFACVSRPLAATGGERWLINLAHGAMSETNGSDYQWCITGEPAAWEEVISGRLDLGTSVRRSELRYWQEEPDAQPTTSRESNGAPVAVHRVNMIGDLLGLTPWLAGIP